MSAAENAPPRGGMVRNILHLGLGQVATTALTVLLTAAIARTLGAADFGLLYLLMSIATFGYVFVDWGHGQYVTREVARHPSRAGDLMGSVLVVRSATALIVCGLTVVTTWLLGYDLRTRVLAAVTVVALLPSYLGLSYSWAFRGRERMDCDALIQVVLKLTGLIVSVVFLALGGRLLAMILVSLVSGTITLALAMALYRSLQLPPIRVTADTARELVVRGSPMLAISLAIAVQPYIDANMLYKLAPRGVLGWYGAASNLAGTLVGPATILAATMYPRLSKASNDPDAFERALRTAFRPLLFVAVLVAAGTYLFADVAVGLVYSRQKFGPAGSILRAFSPALLLIYIDLFFGNAILASGRAGRLASAKVVAVLGTTGLEFILIPWCQARFDNGGIGIMFAITAGELVMMAAAFLLIRKFVGARMMVDLLLGLLAGGATVLLMRLLPPVTPFLGIPLCVLSMLGLSVAVGLVNRSDLELLAVLWKRSPVVVGGAPADATL
jgi:O-antigen/teichoic acid export membrane protein